MDRQTNSDADRHRRTRKQRERGRVRHVGWLSIRVTCCDGNERDGHVTSTLMAESRAELLVDSRWLCNGTN